METSASRHCLLIYSDDFIILHQNVLRSIFYTNSDKTFDQITVSVSDNRIPLRRYYQYYYRMGVRRMNGQTQISLSSKMEPSITYCFFFLRTCAFLWTSAFKWKKDVFSHGYVPDMSRVMSPPSTHSERLLIGRGSSDWPSMVRWLVKNWFVYWNSFDRSVKEI